MVDPALWGRLRELLSYYTGAPEAGLDAASCPQNTAGWDSVANLGLMGAIEDEFGVMVASEDVIRLRTLGDIAAFVVENRGKAPGTATGA